MSNGRRAKKSEVDKQLSNWTKRRVLSWSLFSLAGLVAVQHLLAHGGTVRCPSPWDGRTS